MRAIIALGCLGLIAACGPDRDLLKDPMGTGSSLNPEKSDGAPAGVPSPQPGAQEDPGGPPAAPVDSDGDGLRDDEELAMGTDPYAADTDGDGWTDSEEIWTEHTVPTDPSDRPYQGGWTKGACRWSVQSTGNDPGDVADDFQLVDQFGDTVRLHDFCDRAVLLVTSADWCGACQSEAPDLQSWYQQFEDQGFLVITLLGEGDPADWATYFGLEHPVVSDPGYGVSGRYVGGGTFYLPTMHLMSDGAEIVATDAWITQSDVVAALP